MQDQNIIPEQNAPDNPVALSGEADCAPLSLQQKYLRFAAVLTTAYLCTVFLLHPLVFSNLYFNITETKHIFFLAASGVYLLALLFARIALPPD